MVDRKSSRLITLFSETDSRGKITFVNPEFCEISKYTRDQLIGRSHSIIRHPDMPKKLFELLWKTIKAGNIFKAVIKNRASDGSHYWVQATIMPVIQDGDMPVNYVGVRHLIEDENVAREMFERQSRDLHLFDPVVPAAGI